MSDYKPKISSLGDLEQKGDKIEVKNMFLCHFWKTNFLEHDQVAHRSPIGHQIIIFQVIKYFWARKLGLGHTKSQNGCESTKTLVFLARNTWFENKLWTNIQEHFKNIKTRLKTFWFLQDKINNNHNTFDLVRSNKWDNALQELWTCMCHVNATLDKTIEKCMVRSSTYSLNSYKDDQWSRQSPTITQSKEYVTLT